MYFDFFNYTFSAAISFVTAIFGMSYPLLIESIHKIDDRYHSRHLKARFEDSLVLKWYNSFLIISVITSPFIPFWLVAAESMSLIRHIFISVQMVTLLLLILLTIYLVRHIQLYNNPRELMEYILQSATRRDLNAVIDIMKNISQGEDPDLYRKGMQWIIKIIREENLSYGRV